MRKVKLKSLKRGDVVIVNHGSYYVFRSLLVLGDKVAVIREGDIPKYYLSTNSEVNVAETLSDFKIKEVL